MSIKIVKIVRNVYVLNVPVGASVGELMTTLSSMCAPNAKLLEQDDVNGKTQLVFELEEYL